MGEVNRQGGGGSTLYYNIVGGKITREVTEGTPGAVSRKNKKDRIVWELQSDGLQGKITGLFFNVGEYGASWSVVLSDSEGHKMSLGLGTNTNYCSDFLEKLPNINLEEPVTLYPYDFEDEKTKKVRRGITVEQGGKLQTFFKDKENNYAPLHGYPPSPIGSNVTTNKWRAYFGEVEDFLNDYTKEHIVPKLAGAKSDAQTMADNAPPPSDPQGADKKDDNDDLPF